MHGLDGGPSRKEEPSLRALSPSPGRSRGFGLALTWANIGADSPEGRRPEAPGFPRPGGRARAPVPSAWSSKHHQVSRCRPAAVVICSPEGGDSEERLCPGPPGLAAFGPAPVCFLCFGVRTLPCLGRTVPPRADDDGAYARPALPLLLFLGVSSREVRENEKPFSGRKVFCCFSLTSKSLRKRLSFKISGCRPLSRTAS